MNYKHDLHVRVSDADGYCGERMYYVPETQSVDLGDNVLVAVDVGVDKYEYACGKVMELVFVEGQSKSEVVMSLEGVIQSFEDGKF